MIDAYEDENVVEKFTNQMVDSGINVFQIHKLAETEEGHIAELFNFFNPAYNDTILDLGCGVGYVAEYMKSLGADLNFVLLNRSASQLNLCPSHFPKVLGSFEAIPEDTPPVDSAMMQYALGHSNPDAVFSELRRVLPVGGLFFLYDLTTYDIFNRRRMEEELNYIPYTPSLIEGVGRCHGFNLVHRQQPDILYTSHFDAIHGKKFSEQFPLVHPNLFRFIREQ